MTVQSPAVAIPAWVGAGSDSTVDDLVSIGQAIGQPRVVAEMRDHVERVIGWEPASLLASAAYGSGIMSMPPRPSRARSRHRGNTRSQRSGRAGVRPEMIASA